MNSDLLKMWLVSQPMNFKPNNSLLPSNNRDTGMHGRAFAGPEIVSPGFVPSSNGLQRIKMEPIDNESRSAMHNGDTGTFERKDPIKLSKIAARDRRLRELGVTMSDSSAPNVCQMCGKWFRSRQQVAQHLLVHTDERRYKCAYCDRAFKQASHLQQHHRIHTGEKPYRCPLPGCARAFPQLSNLNHHLRNHDKPDPPVSNTCVYCKRVYASEAVLRTHMEKIHSKQKDGEINRYQDQTNGSVCENGSHFQPMNQNHLPKLASAPVAAMTVAPPVLNFSQTFLSPYIHELNFVQLPANLTKYITLPTHSNMTLPVSAPKQNGDHSLEGETKFRQSETSPATCNHADIKTIDGKDRSNEMLKINPLSPDKNKQFDSKPGMASTSFDKINYSERQFRNSVVKAIDGAITVDNIDSFVEEEDDDSGGELTVKGENMGRTSARYSYTLGECGASNAANSINSIDKYNHEFGQNAIQARRGLIESNGLLLSNDQELRSKSHSRRDIVAFDKDNTTMKQGGDEYNLSSPDKRQRNIHRHNGFHTENDVDNQEHNLRCADSSKIAIDDSRETLTNDRSFADTTREVLTHSRKRKAFRPQRVVHDKVFLKDADT